MLAVNCSTLRKAYNNLMENLFIVSNRQNYQHILEGVRQLEAGCTHQLDETLQAIDDVNNHRNMSRKFSSVDELIEDLNT